MILIDRGLKRTGGPKRFCNNIFEVTAKEFHPSRCMLHYEISIVQSCKSLLSDF